MKTIIEMREKRAALYKEANGLHEKAKTESRDLDATEQEQYDRLMGEMDSLKATIDREERQLELQKEFEQRDGSAATRPPVGDEQRGGTEQHEEEVRSAFNAYLANGMEGITPEQRALVMERRALSATTGSAGAFTVPQGFYNSLIQAMKAFGGMRRSRATVLRTGQGNPLPIPMVDDTANVGAILAENTQAGTQDVAFTQKMLGAYKYTSKVVLVPIELLQDSAFNIEQFLVDVLSKRIGRITNTHFTTGSGTGQPQGIVTGATLGKAGTTGQTTSITFDDLVDLVHAVDIERRANAQFMFHDTTLKALKKMKDGQSRPLWLPGVALNEPDTINGYTYLINNDVAQMAASAKSLIFGDMSAYMIRDVMDVSVIRMGEKYADSGQVGFVAFSRHDGALINPGDNPVVYYANSAT